jgi:AraC family transcriptional regulator
MSETARISARLPTGALGAYTVLGHGEIFGQSDDVLDTEGFTVTRLRADPRIDVQRHTHESAHFIFVMNGDCITSASGPRAAHHLPLLVYNPPGTTHRDRFRESNGQFGGAFLSVSISPQRLKEIERQIILPANAMRVRSTEAIEIARRFARELERSRVPSPIAVEEFCLELAGAAARAGVRRRGAPPRWLRLARDMLRDRCADHVTIGAIARTCGVHPVHLARVFRGYLACSPGDYLRRSRLERAASLLRTSNGNLADVALDAGFADQSHMNRAFRRAHAVTPAEYRRATAR